MSNTHASLRRRGSSAAFTPADESLAVMGQALAHPARIAILRFLAGQRGCYCGRIVNELPLAQSTISQHLRALKQAGLIQGTVDGTKVCYCLDPAGVARLRHGFAELVQQLFPEPTNGACDPCDREPCPPEQAS